MAIYHCSVKPISRGAGQSIVAAAAYRHGCRMEDKRTGEVHDYSRKRGVTVSAAFFPSNVDCSWATKSEILWNTAELAEKRKDARLGREIVLALPSELSPTERKALAEEMAQHVADRYGVAVDAAIHAPSRQGDERNFHVHMLVSSRRITSKGFGEKTRELDDRERGPAEVEHIRSEWARLTNHALEKAGQQITIDHRSFQRQGVNRIPTLHLGASANALERRGIQTRIGDRNRSAQVFNAKVKALEKMERPRHDPVPEKTQPRPRSLSEIRMGMAAFVGNFASHKKKAEEAERRKKERRQQEEKRRQAAYAENLVARTAERPDVQEQRKEAQEREQERERQRQEQKKRRSMSLGR